MNNKDIDRLVTNAVRFGLLIGTLGGLALGWSIWGIH